MGARLRDRRGKLDRTVVADRCSLDLMVASTDRSRVLLAVRFFPHPLATWMRPATPQAGHAGCGPPSIAERFKESNGWMSILPPSPSLSSCRFQYSDVPPLDKVRMSCMHVWPSPSVNSCGCIRQAVNCFAGLSPYNAPSLILLLSTLNKALHV